MSRGLEEHYVAVDENDCVVVIATDWGAFQLLLQGLPVIHDPGETHSIWEYDDE